MVLKITRLKFYQIIEQYFYLIYADYFSGTRSENRGTSEETRRGGITSSKVQS